MGKIQIKNIKFTKNLIFLDTIEQNKENNLRTIKFY